VSVPPEDTPVPLSRSVKDRRDLAPIAVALGIVVFVVVGVVKPWTAISSSRAASSAAVVAPSPPRASRAAPSAAVVLSSPSPTPTKGAFIAGLIAGSELRQQPVAAIPNGWVAFSKFHEGGIYLVREGIAARRITEADDGSLVQACPAFSADGRRLAYGQASGTYERGYHDASLVVADLAPEGHVTGSISIPLEGLSAPPCGTWSSDGRWIALGVTVPSLRNLGAGGPIADEVWLVDLDTHAIRRLTGLAATDLEWSPDGTQLAIANDVISLYSAAADEITPIGYATGVQSLSWSPDGQRLAYERSGRISPELWIMNADGTDPAPVATGYDAMHGIGPVWSPDGRRIAFQRVCANHPSPTGLETPCRERHEVVLLSVGAAPVVLPPPRTDGPAGPTWWYPFSVTWSPDGTQLLYHAWSEGAESGLVVVPVDGGGPPIVLYEGHEGPGSVAVYSGTPWVPFQAWGRQAW